MPFKSLALAAFIVTGAAVQKQTPPRGWNSYDSFTKNVNETEFLANCEAVAKYLLPHGYDTCTIDYLWYEPDNGDWFLDEYCRPIPEVARFPSSAGGKGLKPVADKVHAMGLKFGIHIMRGTSTYAKQKNCKVKGTNVNLADIVSMDKETVCPWKKQSLSVDVSKPGGQEFFDSLYEQYAVDWDVDFIKNDCVFGGNLNPVTLAQIRAQSKSIQKFASVRNITYSLSPGGGNNRTVGAGEVSKYVNMYRVTGDTWDHWSMLEDHFVTASEMADAKLIGAAGPAGSKSFPDLDMLPLGFVTQPGDSHKLPNHMSNLTKDEQTQLMTIWAMARSPLVFGGDARVLGTAKNKLTLELLTNKDMLDISDNSFNNHEVKDGFYPVSCPPWVKGNYKCGRMWAAELPGSVYVAAFFNSDGDDPYVTMRNFNKVFGVKDGEDCQVFDVWNGKKLSATVNSTLTLDVPAHGAALIKLSDCKAPSSIIV